MNGKGNFFLGNGQFELREMSFGKLEAGDVLIQNMACGVCY